jgi:DNA repair photolyase
MIMAIKIKKINVGIREDLQADVRYEENACRGYTLDVSIGCSHKCIYCLFSPLEIGIYKKLNPNYKGQSIPLKADKFLARTEFPPAVYMSYSSDPLANDEVRKISSVVLEKLLLNNVNVLFISKGKFTDEILEIMKIKPELIEAQVGIASCKDERNALIEPGAASYSDRLKNIKKLSEIKGLGSLVVRMDPLFPLIDDTPENVNKILDDVSSLGVKKVNVGYIVLTEDMRNRLKKNNRLKDSMEMLSEKTPTISLEKSLYSFPFEIKLERLNFFNDLCNNKGISMTVCACKDERLKKHPFPWVCHPYTRRPVNHHTESPMPGWLFEHLDRK